MLFILLFFNCINNFLREAVKLSQAKGVCKDETGRAD